MEPNKPMTADEIRQALRDHGSSYYRLAKELKITDTAVVRVAQGKSISDRVMKAIAAKLGQEPGEIFPGHYSKKENNKLPKPREK